MSGPKTPPTVPLRSTRRAPPVLARDCALFLDIDGTLAEYAERPDDVRIDAVLMRAIPRVAALLGGALALITGRSITAVDRLFPQLHLPMAGQHGSERRDADGAIHVHAPDPATLAKLRKLFHALADRHPVLRLEDKGNTLAVHYREAPQLASPLHRVLRSSLRSIARGSFDLQPGKQMVEVVPGGRDKGTAVVDFMREPPFAGRRPVFVGDDKADEHGFAVVDDSGGWSIKVGRGTTRARYRLRDIASVRGWLMSSIAADGRASGTEG